MFNHYPELFHLLEPVSDTMFAFPAGRPSLPERHRVRSPAAGIPARGAAAAEADRAEEFQGVSTFL